MFLIRYFDSVLDDDVVLQLSPAPTDIDYPEERLFVTHNSRDSGVVVQRSVRDNRPRRWTWVNYRPNIATYETQWETIKSLDAKTRLTAGYADPYVEIWEDETGEGGFGLLTSGTAPNFTTYANLKWTTVSFLQVHRSVRKGGGPVVFEDSYIEFVIYDDNYNTF